MNFETIASGFISQQRPGTATAIAAGSRCVQRPDGELVCTFVAQAKSGGNDFKPMISRSKDGGASWSQATLIWPELQDRYSIFGSISAAANGDLYFYGMRTPIERAGEMAWSDETNGLKQNQLVWTRSVDGGKTWAPFSVIPMPIPGSAEAAGAMCIARDGKLVCCYAPYNTFDPALSVATNQVICLRSNDGGASWQHTPMLQFSDPRSLGAESWVIELSSGDLLCTAWHIRGDAAEANKYALSHDGGRTWTATRSTGILGQSTALAALRGGEALFVYNQRQHGDVGVWLAHVKPTDTDFGVMANERVWAAEIASRGTASTDFKDWTSFAFGEPSVTPLHDGTILVTLWALQPSGHGIRFVKLRMKR